MTQDMVETLMFGDGIAVLRGGRLVQAGTPAASMRSPAGDFVGGSLDTPGRNTRLVNALLAAGAGGS